MSTNWKQWKQWCLSRGHIEFVKLIPSIFAFNKCHHYYSNHHHHHQGINYYILIKLCYASVTWLCLVRTIINFVKLVQKGQRVLAALREIINRSHYCFSTHLRYTYIQKEWLRMHTCDSIVCIWLDIGASDWLSEWVVKPWRFSGFPHEKITIIVIIIPLAHLGLLPLLFHTLLDDWRWWLTDCLIYYSTVYYVLLQYGKREDVTWKSL